MRAEAQLAAPFPAVPPAALLCFASCSFVLLRTSGLSPPPAAVRQDDTERIASEQADERRREETVKRIKEEEERREKELRRRRREADIDAPEVIFILRELLEPEGGTGLELVGF